MSKTTWKLSELEKQEICSLYQKGSKNKDLMKEYNINHGSVRHILKTNKVKLRKYKVNDNAFSFPLNEEKAYWIGFLLADGYISEQGKNKEYRRLGLGLAGKDIAHLKKFKKFIKSDNPIYKRQIYNKYSFVTLQIVSKQIIEDLDKYEIHPRKTNNHKTPNIPENLKNHFYRGYIDGDGWFTKDRKNDKYIVGVLGPYNFLKDFIKWLSVNCNVNPNIKIPQSSENCHKFTYGGNINFYKITNLLYNNAKTYLTRKNKIYKKFMRKYYGS